MLHKEAINVERIVLGFLVVVGQAELLVTVKRIQLFFRFKIFDIEAGLVMADLLLDWYVLLQLPKLILQALNFDKLVLEKPTFTLERFIFLLFVQPRIEFGSKVF